MPGKESARYAPGKSTERHCECLRPLVFDMDGTCALCGHQTPLLGGVDVDHVHDLAQAFARIVRD